MHLDIDNLIPCRTNEAALEIRPLDPSFIRVKSVAEILP